MYTSTLIALALATAASARPAFQRRQASALANGQAAIALNQQFASLTTSSSCTTGEDACVNQKFAQCVGGSFVVQACGPGTICAALPLTSGSGTTIACTTQSDLDARIAATGATSSGTTTAAADTTSAAAAASTSVSSTDNSASSGSGSDLQSSTTLDPSVIQNVDDGQNPPTAGQTAAVVSQNNFMNFCALTLPNTPLTNGLQLTTGSCNPTPIGLIPSSDKMPSGKFQNPKNGATIPANKQFTITLQVKNIQLGDFTNAQQTYFANPQTLNSDGVIIGHTHFVIEAVDSLASTKVTDPTEFIFFKGVDDAQDADGNVSVNVTAGVPAGTYRMGTIVAASTHQPAIVPIAQHGLLDDVVYFTAK
uniref:Carbohydrate-binding module family 19 domain-containing protein n=1 Tax=Mycena chlorophos TaxID=658473 RepID=A0ABQ0KXK9_MYCCL|nr:predicted protein [Mycena chlorophos]